MKKSVVILITVTAIILVGGALGLYFWLNSGQAESQNSVISKCQTNEMIFYYSNGCGYCSKVKNDGSLQKLEDLGVAVNQVEVSVGPILHQFSGVPTFVVNDQVYSGYRTYDQLRQLLNCTE